MSYWLGGVTGDSNCPYLKGPIQSALRRGGPGGRGRPGAGNRAGEVAKDHQDR